MKSLFLDTSYILALVNTSDEFHSQAQELAHNINTTLVTTEAILTEIGNALAKLKWRRLALDILNDLRTDEAVKIISVDSQLFSKALKLYSSRMDKEWGFTDCISFIVMKDKKLTESLTTDHHFEQAGFRPLLLNIRE
ncbi:MAG: type II toxin-antitoxin system VapC family toxin [Desulfobacterales bacterium]|nr:type II toxin-antitoxin system VapC family toxin [Desulfobacterales bacterium]